MMETGCETANAILVAATGLVKFDSGACGGKGLPTATSPL